MRSFPQSLSEQERGSDPVKRGAAVPVKVWVDYGNAAVQVLASAVAWSRGCVLVVWMDFHDQEQEVRAWTGAVERISPGMV